MYLIFPFNPVSAEPPSRFTHFKLCLSKHTLVLKPMTSTERDYKLIVILMIFVSPPTAATSSKHTHSHALIQAETCTHPHPQSKACTHIDRGTQTDLVVHKLSRFLFSILVSADTTNSLRVLLLLNWRLDPEAWSFSGSPTTRSCGARLIIAVCHPVKAAFY